MAIKRTKAEKKIAYDRKLCQLLDEYTKVLVAVADNVGSKQLQDIRRGLRGDSVVLMGKNTLIRRCIKVHAEKTGNKDFEELSKLLVVSLSPIPIPRPVLGFLAAWCDDLCARALLVLVGQRRAHLHQG
jgi:ribosomal protein L10